MTRVLSWRIHGGCAAHDRAMLWSHTGPGSTECREVLVRPVRPEEPDNKVRFIALRTHISRGPLEHACHSSSTRVPSTTIHRAPSLITFLLPWVQDLAGPPERPGSAVARALPVALASMAWMERRVPRVPRVRSALPEPKGAKVPLAWLGSAARRQVGAFPHFSFLFWDQPCNGAVSRGLQGAPGVTGASGATGPTGLTGAVRFSLAPSSEPSSRFLLLSLLFNRVPFFFSFVLRLPLSSPSARTILPPAFCSVSLLFSLPQHGPLTACPSFLL